MESEAVPKSAYVGILKITKDILQRKLQRPTLSRSCIPDGNWEKNVFQIHQRLSLLDSFRVNICLPCFD